MAHDLYQVTTYEPIQVSPCVGSGLRAKFSGYGEEPGHTSPVAAMVICRVKRDYYRDGKFVQNISVCRELCGVITYSEEGFGFCEETSNFQGYIQPGDAE